MLLSRRRAAGFLPRALAGLVALALQAPLAAAQGATAPAPASRDRAATNAGVLGYLAIPDLDKAVRHAEALGQSISPGKTPPGSFKMILGAMLGDPALAQLRAGEPLVMIVFAPAAAGTPSYAWLIPVKDGAGYAKALGAKGWATREAGGLLLAGSAAAALDQAQAERGLYDRVRTLGGTGDARITLHADPLMTAFGPAVQTAFESMAAAASSAASGGTPQANPAATPEMQRLLKVEGRVFLDLFRQVDQMRMDVSLDGGAIGLDTEVAPKRGSSLADLAQMAPPAANSTAALLAGSGVMTAVYQLEAARLSTFMTKMIDGLAGDPDAAQFLTPELRQLLMNSSWFDGRASYHMRPGAGGRLVTEMVMAVTDEAKALEMVERGMNLMAPGTGWSKMYEAMGIGYKSSFEKAFRQHRGIAVHRVTISMDAKNTPPAQVASMKAMLGDMDIAVTHGLYLMSQDPASLDAMIDRALAKERPAPETLRAMAAFGPGAHFYCDYDLIGLMRSIAATSDAKTLPSLPPSTAPDPMTVAATLSQGSLKFRTRLPLMPFIAMGQAAAAAKAQASAPAPKPKPKPKP
jgi:hypothetical protein